MSDETHPDRGAPPPPHQPPPGAWAPPAQQAPPAPPAPGPVPPQWEPPPPAGSPWSPPPAAGPAPQWHPQGVWNQPGAAVPPYSDGVSPEARAAAWKEVSQRAWREVLVGLIAIVVGIVITVASYSVAPGGMYVVGWGPVLYGVISMVRGLKKFLVGH
jgi:hypothetical protein